MAGIPGVKPIRWYERKALLEAILVVPTVIASSVGMGNLFYEAYTSTTLTADARRTKYLFGGALALAIALSIFGGVVRFLQGRTQDQEQKTKNDHDGLIGALFVIHNLVKIKARNGKLDDNQLRIAVHRVVPPENEENSPEWLEQITRYVGGTGSSAGRKFSMRSGIVGKVVREKTAHTASRPTTDYEAYIQELVSKWSYTESEARKLTRDRMSWMAIPIQGTENKVIAVLYLDSNESNFFVKPVKDLILGACGGVASYIQEKYR